MPTNPNKPHRNINRVSRNNTNSWHVTIIRMHKSISKHFNDKIYGGSDQALKAAILFRDEKLKELDNSEYALWRKRLGGNPLNTSGIPGVGRYIRKQKNKNGTITERAEWQAFWDDTEGKRHLRTFNIKKHGEEGAKQMAIEARTQAMIKLYGKPDIMTPEEAQETEEMTKNVRKNTIEQPPPKPRKLLSGKIERNYFLRYSTGQKRHVSYPYWRASWLDNNSKFHSARFTIYQYGEEKALKLAMEALKKALEVRLEEDN
jgi:AP2 domain